MMAKYRKKPIVVEATQWFNDAGHPQVQYWRTPEGEAQTLCKHCDRMMCEHGWIDTLEGGHNVCPGDWIIEGIKGEFHPCKPDVSEATYEAEAEMCHAGGGAGV